MTDNFKLYRNYITEGFASSKLNEGDTYYVVELMRRGKDNPDLPAANYHFKNYYIRKVEDLDKYEDEIKLLCETLRLRAYASVNYKSFRQVTLDTVAELACRAAKSVFSKPYAVFESCSGKYVNSENKRWVLDFDEKDLDWSVIENMLSECKPEGSKVICKFPTKSGLHFITIPFDIGYFNQKWNIIMQPQYFPDIKKNHLTLLYENL